MKSTPYDNEIANLEKQKKALEDGLFASRKKRAEFLCPVHVGDTITDKTGKKQAVITRIVPHRGYGYELHGRLILKSGKQGTLWRPLYSWAWPSGYPKEDE